MDNKHIDTPIFLVLLYRLSNSVYSLYHCLCLRCRVWFVGDSSYNLLYYLLQPTSRQQIEVSGVRS